jgi:putative ABC transport system ATP-binding protein
MGYSFSLRSIDIVRVISGRENKQSSAIIGPVAFAGMSLSAYRGDWGKNLVMVVLETQQLSRFVNGKALVKDVTMQVERGELLAIIGPSGAGKSSFLRLLNRLDEPSTGTVLLEGKDYRTVPPHQLRQRVGMVLQSPFLFAGTVAENIRFGPRQRGEDVSQAKVEKLLEQVGLSDYAERDVGTLSGGEAQRVSLIRTLANEPHVLLVDEPTSALDDATVQCVEQLISSFVRQQHITCLMITHSMEQTFRLAHRVMVLEQGQLTKIGTPEEIIHAK